MILVSIRGTGDSPEIEKAPLHPNEVRPYKTEDLRLTKTIHIHQMICVHLCISIFTNDF